MPLHAPVPDALKRALFNASTRYAVLAWDGDAGFVYQKWGVCLAICVASAYIPKAQLSCLLTAA